MAFSKKALCDHFARKTNAHYEGEKGFIQFGDGKCEITASATSLMLQVKAEVAENLACLQRVVGDRLLLFTPDENWNKTLFIPRLDR